MKKLIKISTVPESLNGFCKGQLKMLSSFFEVIAISSPLKELKEIEEREQVRCLSVPMERHISFLKDIVSLYRMIIIFHKERPYIVHSMTPKAGLICMIAAWINRVPVRMHTYTGLVFPTATGLTQRILIFTDRILCFCANYINPEGYGVAKDLKRFGITKKPLHVIANGNVRGIDLDYWDRSNVSMDISAFNDNSKCFKFLFVGRLVRDKGINELIEAFTKLTNEGQYNVQLLLVGPYEERLDPLNKKTIEEIETNENIIRIGKQSDVRPYYAQADAFVFPSYREGFPNTVLEAGIMGLPQIVTDINGANEIIIDGQNGVIIPPKNADALYEAMKKIVDSPDLIKELSSKAREMIATRFEQKYIWSELLKVYQSFE